MRKPLLEYECVFFFFKRRYSQTVSLYPLHAARSVWEDHPSSQAAALFKCVAAKAPPPVSSTQWGMWRAVGVDPLTSPRFQKQNAMGLTFLDVLLLAVSRMYTDRKLCSASMKWIIVNDLIGSVFGQSVCLSFWCLISVFCSDCHWHLEFLGPGDHPEELPGWTCRTVENATRSQQDFRFLGYLDCISIKKWQVGILRMTKIYGDLCWYPDFEIATQPLWGLLLPSNGARCPQRPCCVTAGRLSDDCSRHLSSEWENDRCRFRIRYVMMNDTVSLCRCIVWWYWSCRGTLWSFNISSSVFFFATTFKNF